MIDVNEIVREAKQSKDPNAKRWVSEIEMLAFIKAGARIIKDHKQYSGSYVTEVIYTDESGKKFHLFNTRAYPLFPITICQVH